MDSLLTFFVHFQSPPLIAAIFVGIPSGALYLIEVILVLTNWDQFNSSFFKLFLVRAIPSIWNLFCSYWSFRLPMLLPVLFLPLYLQIPRFLLRTFFFSSYYTFHVENLSTFFLILNRLTAILLPFRHHNIWKFGVPLAIAIIFSLPLPFNFTAFGLSAEIIFLDAKNAIFSFVTPHDEYPFSRAASLSAVIFIAICTLLNIATVVAYRRHKRSSVTIGQPAGGGNGNWMESRLTKYALVTFFCQISMGFCFLSMFITQNVAFQKAYMVGFAIYNFYALANDIFTVAIPAWSMLWTSSKMRQLFLNKFPFLNILFGHTSHPGATIKMATNKVRSKNVISQT